MVATGGDLPGRRVRFRRGGDVARPPGRPDLPRETIADADDRILLTGYTVTDGEIADELHTALDRGVEVRILLDYNASLRDNREVALAVHGDGIGSYYADDLYDDWEDNDTWPLPLGLLSAITPALVVAVGAVRRYVPFGAPERREIEPRTGEGLEEGPGVGPPARPVERARGRRTGERRRVGRPRAGRPQVNPRRGSERW